MEYTKKDIASVFNEDCLLMSLEDCARKSSVVFVRSQLQLAFATKRSTGHRLNAFEAYTTYGLDTLLKVAREGSAPLISNGDEPGLTLKKRREELNLTVDQLASNSKLEASAILNAETPGKISRIRVLEQIAQKLALDERLLGSVVASGGDNKLGVRLRELASADVSQFSPSVVMELAESAWIISRQIDLRKVLGIPQHNLVTATQKDGNYNYPSWQYGYTLAERTRNKLGIYDDSPINSLRDIIENKFGIPLIQISINPKFAGATISNQSDRGIVVNECGLNGNVLVRRMTMCHELGHLLWDPDTNLNKLAVDEYDALDDWQMLTRRDPVEIRANAFAVAFLAPPAAVRNIIAQEKDPQGALARVVNEYGISPTAAKHHICNVTQTSPSSISLTAKLPPPLKDWTTQENLTIDYIPIETTPISRRGRFVSLVAQSFVKNFISSDTAALLLNCTPEEIELHAHAIISMTT